MTKQGQRKIKREVIEQRGRTHFGGHQSLSVELFKAQKYPNTKQFKWQLNLESWKTYKGHGKSWNLKSLKEYKPC